MPYIKNDRESLVRGERCPKEPGELNFLVTVMLLDVLKEQQPDLKRFEERLLSLAMAYAVDEPLKYQRINDIVGAFTGAWMEFIRRKTDGTYDTRAFSMDTAELYDAAGNSIGLALEAFYKNVAGPYENKKIKENGDVY